MADEGEMVGSFRREMAGKAPRWLMKERDGW
jgi:hypothetical protein